MVVSSYKNWRPSKKYLEKLSISQLTKIDKENDNWPSGPEGGRFDSPEGMRSSSFSVIWFYLSLLARGIPVRPDEERKQHLHQLLLSLGETLPCGACRKHFQKNLVQAGYNPRVHLQSRQAFSRFVCRLHNVVNVTLGKPTVAYEEHRLFYETLRAKCTSQGCNESFTDDDKQATCVIRVISDVEANKFVEKNGGRISMSEECRLPPLQKTQPKRVSSRRYSRSSRRYRL
jgi:hypothetical protein